MCPLASLHNALVPIGLTLQKLDTLFTTRLGDYPAHGPLLLGWAVVRCGKVTTLFSDYNILIPCCTLTQTLSLI